ncbi:unnamed protein product [Caretta caretta]
MLTRAETSPRAPEPENQELQEQGNRAIPSIEGELPQQQMRQQRCSLPEANTSPRAASHPSLRSTVLQS